MALIVLYAKVLHVLLCERCGREVGGARTRHGLTCDRCRTPTRNNPVRLFNLMTLLRDESIGSQFLRQTNFVIEPEPF